MSHPPKYGAGVDDKHGFHGLGDNQLYDDAWAFVIKHQGDQVRNGTDIPYTTHLRGAARLALDDGGTPEEVVAALLHDVVEDTPVSPGGDSIDFEDMRRTFGDRVAEIVKFCTDAAPPAGEDKKPWRGRKEAHFEHLRAADPGTLRVVVADKTDNITGQIADLEACAGDEKAVAGSLARFKGGFAGTLWYYRGMCAAMGDTLVGSELYGRLTGLIDEFASLRESGAQEADCQARVRAVLDRLDPHDVGLPVVEDGYYSIDAYELARRTNTPGAASEEEVVETLVAKWYRKDAWGQSDLDEIAGALLGGTVR